MDIHTIYQKLAEIFERRENVKVTFSLSKKEE